MNENRDKMMRWLMANGFKDNSNAPLTLAQAAAVAGNFQAESNFGFNVTEGHKLDGATNDQVDTWTQGGPRGLGMAQWTWNPGRAGNLIALARRMKGNWYDPEVQFQHILNEVNGGYGARLAKAGFFAADKKPGELAIIFHDIYEGSADTPAMKQRRATFAEEAYASITGGAKVANLKNHPGKWLRDDAAASIDRFERDHGVQPITEAGRTPAYQQELINRWRAGGKYNRPPYLYEPAGVNVSKHVINGGVAIDTSNPSVFHTYGQYYGWFFNFAYDKVHFEYDASRDKSRGVKPVPAPSKPGAKPNLGKAFGIKDVRGLQKIARANGGNTTPDNKWGEGSATGWRNFLKKYGYVGNIVRGPVMIKAEQVWLKAKWGYKGDLDGKDGPQHNAALKRANDANFKAL